MNMEKDQWYKDAILYEVPVKSFFDSNGDGIGDLRGMAQKLDYIKDLGITAIWLLPFYPSPLRDDGYDIADYTDIHHDYGTISDFRELIREAKKRDLRIITELVLNHTSDQHPWFQRARRSPPGSRWRDFYVWSDTPDRYCDARIIFKDFESSNWTWDPLAKAYFWHRFYTHQPDLNFHNPQVQKSMRGIVDFWFRMGVDGMRLDAAPYLFEKEGTDCENLPETHEFLKNLRAYIDERHPGRMLLAEANQWPEDAVAYFGRGDECHMAYHFPLMPRMFMAVQKEDRFPIIDIMDQTPVIPGNCQWALFLRNHDELTLEMVTDGERDYMYRAFASDRRSRINLGIRRRLAPLLGNDRRKIELMNVMLLSLPGTPIIYYGDEIGMGDNYYLGDRNGVRTPMQWRPDLNGGFSSANPQKLYLPVIIDPEYHYAALNVANQEQNPSSLLWWMRRMLSLRKKYRAFSRGSIEFPSLNNSKVIAFIRRHEAEIILVVVNLSRFSQVAEIALSDYADYGVEDLFSENRFPSVREAPYLLTMSPHSYYFLLLKKETPLSIHIERESPPEIHLKPDTEIFNGELHDRLKHSILPGYFQRRLHVGRRAEDIQKIDILDEVFMSKERPQALFLILEILDKEGSPGYRSLPLRYIPEDLSCLVQGDHREAILATVHRGKEDGILIDGTYDRDFREIVYRLMARKRKLNGKRGNIHSIQGDLARMLMEIAPWGSSKIVEDEARSVKILFEDMFLMKLYRQLDQFINPEQEIVRHLTEKLSFPYILPFAGAIEYSGTPIESATIGIIEGYQPHEDSGWDFFLGNAGHYLEGALTHRGDLKGALPDSLLDIDGSKLDPAFFDLAGSFFPEMAARLGRRTAELHIALASRKEDPRFSPEHFTQFYQKSVFQSLRTGAKQVLARLQQDLDTLPDESRIIASKVIHQEDEIMRRYKRFLDHACSAVKIRIHGDYTLNNILFTGKDFIITNFEGPSHYTQSEARFKRSAMRDVCSMIRSFHYAAYSLLLTEKRFRQEDVPRLLPRAEYLYKVLSGIFLRAYLDTARNADFIPKEREELRILLETFLLDHAIEELGAEIAIRPGWLIIPGRGILDILSAKA